MTDEELLASYQALVPVLHNEASEIEGMLALWAGVPLGHPHAQNDESRAMRAAASAIGDLLRRAGGDFFVKRSRPFLQKSFVVETQGNQGFLHI